MTKGKSCDRGGFPDGDRVEDCRRQSTRHGIEQKGCAPPCQLLSLALRAEDDSRLSLMGEAQWGERDVSTSASDCPHQGGGMKPGVFCERAVPGAWGVPL